MNYQEEALNLFPYTRDLRRDFHQHPELGFQEFRTAGIVARELNELGLEVNTGVAETGVVALLEGAGPGPTVLLRFDMDALPIQEETGAEYASQNPGVMHACGHDAHTAIGLTVARMLNEHRDSFAGTVKLVFQPAEEGLGGARRMVEEGVLENPRPDLVLALHVWNDAPLGWIGVTPGPALAGGDLFSVRLTGRGGHGAMPHKTRDPIVTAAHIITALQTVISRNVSPLESSVVSVTAVEAGSAFNVIPQTALLKGTIRTYTEETRKITLERFRQIVEGVAAAMECQAEIDLRRLTPAVINDPELSARIHQVVTRELGADVLETGHRTMGSEDFSYMMQELPGCFLFIGSNNVEAGLAAAHHNPAFDIDERVLPRAAGLMVATALEFLGTPGERS